MNFNVNLSAESYDAGESLEINSYEDYTTDLKFRSIAVDNAPQHGDFCVEPMSNSFAKLNMDFSKTVLTSKLPVPSYNASSCPGVPFGLSNTFFIINNSDYQEVVSSISENLATEHPYHDFSFIDHEHMWKGKYLNGSNSFEVDVNLYNNRSESNFVVGVRKVKNDCCLQSGGFRSFYDSFKSALCTDSISTLAPAVVTKRPRFHIPKDFKYTPSTTSATPCSSSLSGSCNDGVVSSAEFLEGVKPMLELAQCCLENRIECAKMLCDVAKKEARYLELTQFRSEALNVLETLIQDDSDDVRQYAVMAVSALADLASYREAFLQSSVLSALFSLVENSEDIQQAYQLAQVRRTAALVLAMLCRTQPYKVRHELQKQDCDVAGWLQRVPCLHDQRTREAAMTCKQFLDDEAVTSVVGSSQTTAEDCNDCIFSQDLSPLIQS